MPPSDRPDVPGLADERAGDFVPATRTGRIRAILRWAGDATTDDDLFDLLEGMNPDGDKDPID
jgi:hypothetical protein